MTSFAFVLGTIPLAIATGASANSRHSIGTGVIGGTLAATIIAIFFIPMFYWMLETLSTKLFGGEKSEPIATADKKLTGSDAAPGGAAGSIVPQASGEAD
jgi:multidrug efflux pump